MDNPEEILRTRVEGLFGGVFPEFSNCALVEFTTPAGGHQQVQHVVFAGGYRKEEAAPVNVAGDLRAQVDLTCHSILDVWPDAMLRLLVWRRWPSLENDRRLGEYLSCRLTAIPMDAMDVAVTTGDRDRLYPATRGR